MKEKFIKSVVAITMFALVIAPAFALALPAQAAGDADDLLWGGNEDDIESSLGLGNEDPRTIIASIINVALGFLGIIAVVIILLGGFKWMTAGGNEDKTAEARSLIISGIIGLVIILAAWGIARFVVDQLYTATGAGGA